MQDTKRQREERENKPTQNTSFPQLLICKTTRCVTRVRYLEGFKRELDVVGLFQVHVVHQQLTSAELHENSQQLHTQTPVLK